MNEQKKECGCVSNALLVEMLQAMNNQSQAMTAQNNLLAEQNKVMARIVDQNNELIAMMQTEDDEDKPNNLNIIQEFLHLSNENVEFMISFTKEHLDNLKLTINDI